MTADNLLLQLDNPELQVTLKKLLSIFSIDIRYRPLLHLINVLDRILPAANASLPLGEFWVSLEHQLPEIRKTLVSLGIRESGGIGITAERKGCLWKGL